MATIEKPATYEPPGRPGSLVEVKDRYENFIGGAWTPPETGEYRENLSPATGEPFCEIAYSTPADIELALDAAHAAKGAWGKTSAAGRAAVLDAIADAIEDNLEMLAIAESWDNGKPVRETLNADLPLAIDHFRYFAGVIRGEEGSISELDEKTVAYHFREPLGVVGQIIPFNFPLLMAAWKIAPALAAGNCTVVKPASPTPWSILKLAEVIADVVPPGVLNIVNGPGAGIGKALASNKRIAKIAFTGETVTGRLIMQYAAQNLIPSSTELGGKSPNIFFEDVMAADDAFLDKAIEGLVLYAFNKGEVCTCPSRALIQESIYDEFMGRCLERIAAIKQGDPLDLATMIGAAGLDRAAREDRGLRRDRPRGGRGGPDRRPAQRPRGRARRRLLLRAHRPEGPQRHAGLPGGDLRARAGRDDVPRRGRGAGDRQRHDVRAGRRRVEPRRQPGVPDGPRHPGGQGVDELLPPLPGPRGVRRLQDVGRRAREPQDDARPLHADQVPARQL